MGAAVPAPLVCTAADRQILAYRTARYPGFARSQVVRQIRSVRQFLRTRIGIDLAAGTLLPSA